MICCFLQSFKAPTITAIIPSLFSCEKEVVIVDAFIALMDLKPKAVAEPIVSFNVLNPFHFDKSVNRHLRLASP